MNFETMRIHFLSGIFVLLSSRNLAIMATWRNDFSPLLEGQFKFQRLDVVASSPSYSFPASPQSWPQSASESFNLGKFVPPPPPPPASPQIKGEKMPRFVFCAASFFGTALWLRLDSKPTVSSRTYNNNNNNNNNIHNHIHSGVV